MSRRNRRPKARHAPVPEARTPETSQEPENAVSLPEIGADPTEATGAPPGRLFSQLALSKLFGVDRSVIDRWVREGCEPVRGGTGRGVGNEWQFDSAKVFAWHREWLAKSYAKAADDATDPDADLKLLKLAREASLVAPVADFKMAQARAYAELRQTLMPLPDRLARSMDGLAPKPRIDAWVAQAEDVIRHALAAYAATQATAMPVPSPFLRLDDDGSDADQG